MVPRPYTAFLHMGGGSKRTVLRLRVLSWVALCCSVLRAQAVLASRNKTMAPVTLSSRPTQDWQDVIVRTTDGAVGLVQSWRNGWVSCSLQCPRPTPVHALRMVCVGRGDV